MMQKKKSNLFHVILYFILLFSLLLIIYIPSFKNPPRSDYWSAFYVFQQVDASPLPPNWPSILTFDLWQHGTYRPFSHLVPYLEHKLFSPDFIWNHILTFAFYCASIILLYGLASQLSLDRTITAALLVVFAFLFSHFDILTWTFQLFSTLSFCAFLLGFIIFISFLRSGRSLLLIPTGLLFLSGMLCSEVYFFWPLAALILPYALSQPRINPGAGARRVTSLMLGSIYLLYLGVFILHRGTTAGTGPLPAVTIGEIISAFFLVFFNLLYNGIVITIIPALSLPLYYNDNMNLGGLLLNWSPELNKISLWVGIGVALFIGWGVTFLYRRGERRKVALLSFFMLLYFTNFFTVSLARLTTNRAIYPLSQFRYQYIPNALLALMAAVVIGNLIRPGKRLKIIIGLILIPVLAFNIYLSHAYVVDLGKRLTPLRILLANIRSGLENGEINERALLFIEPGVPDSLPAPSWNKNMARFMEGNFQWFFPAGELNKFTLSREGSGWILSEKDYKIIGNR
ncbi:MAG: hypothetical protein RAO92_09540 [Candidatus Euphemobacter frigidus]|nr:hypothetical protein [Candidatus Euphemobacter frigidus]MDP8276625.1 hypothetical protein [Candidatus Euphemobacter frigidus]